MVDIDRTDIQRMEIKIEDIPVAIKLLQNNGYNFVVENFQHDSEYVKVLFISDIDNESVIDTILEEETDSLYKEIGELEDKIYELEHPIEEEEEDI